MIHREKTLNWPYTSCLPSQLYQNWKWWVKIQKSLFGFFSFFYGHHLPEARKDPVIFHLCLLTWKRWKEIRLSSSTSFAKLPTIERRRSLTFLSSQIRKHQYCVAKKRGKWVASTKNLAPGMLSKQNKKGGGAAEGRGCKPWRARKELVGDWDHCDIPDKHFILLFLLF